jgi:hypothetical protein
MNIKQKSFLIPPQFHRLITVISAIEFHYSVLYSLDRESNKSLTKAKINCIKTFEHYRQEFYEEIDFINTNTTKNLKIMEGKTLEVSASYLKCIEIAIDLLLHIDGWGDWYKSAMNAQRKAGRVKKLAPNNYVYKKVTSNMEKELGRELNSLDYAKWYETLCEDYPTPPVISTTRNLKKKSNLPLKPIPGLAAVERENPWPEPTARKKFEELTGCTPMKEKIKKNS